MKKVFFIHDSKQNKLVKVRDNETNKYNPDMMKEYR